MSRIRLLCTAYDYFPRLGGIATSTQNLLNALARQGDIEILLMALRSHTLSDKQDHASVFPIRRFCWSQNTLIASWQISRDLRTVLGEFQADALLHFLWLPEALGSWINRNRIPYFVFAHGVEILESHVNLRKKVRNLFSPLKRAVFCDAASVFAVSRYTRDQLINNTGISPEKITITYNGVDINQFKPPVLPKEHHPSFRKKYALPEGPVLLTVSRLIDYKGIDIGIQALSLILTQYPQASYVVIGTGPDLPRLRALARHHGVEARVLFTDALPPSEVLEAYQAADLLMLLSREDLRTPNVEGFGIVILEAAACSIPTLGGRSGGIPETMQEGQTGWLVDPVSPEEVARVLLECLRDPKELKRRGQAARLYVSEQFTSDQMAKRVFEEIRKNVRH